MRIVQTLVVVISLSVFAGCGGGTATGGDEVDAGRSVDTNGPISSGGGKSSDGRGGGSADSSSNGRAPAEEDAGVDAGNGAASRGAETACGKPGDKGDDKGIGKYCTGVVACLGNKEAQVCANIGDPKATFCTKLCRKNDPDSACGASATCICDPNGGAQCGCTPKSCL